MKAKRTIEVNAPVDKVFSYLTDFSRHSEWDNNFAFEVSSTSLLRLGVGFTCERKRILTIDHVQKSWSKYSLPRGRQLENVFNSEDLKETVAIVKVSEVTQFIHNDLLVYEETVHSESLGFSLNNNQVTYKEIAEAEESRKAGHWPMFLGLPTSGGDYILNNVLLRIAKRRPPPYLRYEVAFQVQSVDGMTRVTRESRPILSPLLAFIPLLLFFPFRLLTQGGYLKRIKANIEAQG